MSRCLILGGPTASGGGGISQLTSTGATVTITAPFGPVTDLEVAAGGGITRIANSDGTVSVANPTGPTTTLSAPGTELQANPVAATVPGTGQVLGWSGTSWGPVNTVASIANGYGITGATGPNPVPAVSLTTVAAVLAAPVSLGGPAAATAVLGITLAIGTWDVTANVTWENTTTTLRLIDTALAFASAVGTWAQTGSTTFSPIISTQVAGGAGNWISVTIRWTAIVTTAGIVNVSGAGNANVQAAAVPSNTGLGTTGATSITATRIA